MKNLLFISLAVFTLFITSSASMASEAFVEDDLYDYEPSQQILQFEDMRDGYYLQFASKPVASREWCKDTVVKQRQLIVGANPVSRVCLEADNRYYLD